MNYTSSSSRRDTNSPSVANSIIITKSWGIGNYPSPYFFGIYLNLNFYRTAIISYQRPGTPVENRLSEFWSIMDFCNSGYLGTAKSFKSGYGMSSDESP